MIENKGYQRTDDFFAAYKNTASQHPHFQHYHDSYEICFFIEANIEVFIRDARYVISDGDIIFINENDIHRFLDNNQSLVFKRFIVNFKKDYVFTNIKAAGIGWILDELKDSRYTYASTSLKEKSELESLFKSLLKAYHFSGKTNSVNSHEAALKLYLVLILIRIWEIIKDYKPENKMSKKGKLVKDIVKYIENNYMSQITLDILEEKFFLDKFYISHTFKEVTDSSIMEYVQQVRVIEAQKMLTDSNDEILEICYKSGFNSAQHFYRVFKKISGTTPEKYKKIAKGR